MKRFSIKEGVWRSNESLFRPMAVESNAVAAVSNQLNINIYKLTVSTKDGIFDCEIQLGVHDVEDVKTICNKLKNMTGIEEVTRID
jgi:GTP diphosphokinase / guanosine-3',5'-bis(diphosphate) 3'-diphosphatase